MRKGWSNRVGEEERSRNGRGNGRMEEEQEEG